MEAANKVLMTTTTTFEGYTIKDYIGPIYSHIVEGTSIFRDMFADVRDIFRGNSKSYEGTLNQMQIQVINKLKRKAKDCGANGIIGISIDFDEISGQGKSMFMVTISGTAVSIQDSRKEKLELIRRSINSNNELEKLKIELEIRNKGLSPANLLKEYKELAELENRINILELEYLSKPKGEKKFKTSEIDYNKVLDTIGKTPKEVSEEILNNTKLLEEYSKLSFQQKEHLKNKFSYLKENWRLLKSLDCDGEKKIFEYIRRNSKN